MLTRWQRTKAHLHYLAPPTRAFLPLLVGFGLLVFAGGVSFHLLYQQADLSLLRALYVTYALVFMEHLLPFPDHWVLQAFYFLLPPLGLVVILDGIVHYSLHLLRRDADSPAWNRAMTISLDNHVILCGLGKAGFRTLQVLLELGEQVCVLEKNAACTNLPWARQRGVPCVVATGRHDGVFDELNAKAAKSIILATDDDLANIEMALDARRARPDIHVVLRVWDQELAKGIRESFDIEVALSTTALAAPLFATSSADPSIVHAFELGERLLVVARIEVVGGSALAGTRLDQIDLERPLHVVEHQRGEGPVDAAPRSDLVLRGGDLLTVQTEPSALQTLHAMNRGPA